MASEPPPPAELPRYRKPPGGPTEANLEDRDRWSALTDQSLASVRAAAEKWRVGLAAYVTLVTGGLFLKGPQAASDLATSWRLALTIPIAGGLLVAIAGLWLALQAAAGTPRRLNLVQVVARFGGVRQFEVAAALQAAALLRWARLLVAVSLLLFVAGLVTWWWAPG